MGTALGNAMKQIGSNLSGNGQTPNEPKTGLCPDCGKIVSKMARTCPHCGRPLNAGDVMENPEKKPPECPLPDHCVAVVPAELFLEVLEKYRASESEVISEYWGDSEHLENLEKEIAEYKKRAGIEE